MLEEALDQFEGAIMFISHDRYFIKKLASKIWAIEAGQIEIYAGDYDYYQAELNKKRERFDAFVDEKPNIKQKSVSENKSKKPSQKSADYEAIILEYEEEKSLLELSMADFSDDYEKLMEIQKEIDQVSNAIENLYTAWLE
jgi:ATP-binding cassette subfamily F protein uup